MFALLHDQCLALASAFLPPSFLAVGRPFVLRDLTWLIPYSQGEVAVWKSREKRRFWTRQNFMRACAIPVCLPVCFVCLLACRRGSREPRVAEREEQTRRKDQSQYRGKGRSGRELLSLKGVYVEPRLIFRSMGLGGCGFLPLVLCVHLACPIDGQILLGRCAMGCCCCFFSFLVCRS